MVGNRGEMGGDRRSSGGQEVQQRVLTTLLTEMDGIGIRTNEMQRKSSVSDCTPRSNVHYII